MSFINLLDAKEGYSSSFINSLSSSPSTQISRIIETSPVDPEYIYEFVVDSINDSTSLKLIQIDLYDADDNLVSILSSDIGDVLANSTGYIGYLNSLGSNPDNIVSWLTSDLVSGSSLFKITTYVKLNKIVITYPDPASWLPILIKLNWKLIATSPDPSTYELTKTYLLYGAPDDVVVEPEPEPVVAPTFVSWSDALTDTVTLELNTDYTLPNATFNNESGNFIVYPSIISKNISTYYTTLDLYAGASLPVSMTANVGAFALSSYQVQLDFDPNILTFTSFFGDSKFNNPTVGTATSGRVALLMSGIKSGTTLDEVRGDVDIGFFNFTVKDTVVGVADLAALMLEVVSITNSGGNQFVNNVGGIINDVVKFEHYELNDVIDTTLEQSLVYYYVSEYGTDQIFVKSRVYNIIDSTPAPESIINTIVLGISNNNLTVVLDITNPESGWTGTLYNQTTAETITVLENFTQSLNYTGLDNGTWIFTGVSSDGVETVSSTGVIDYTAPPDIVNNIQFTNGSWYSDSLYYMYNRTENEKFVYRLSYDTTYDGFDIAYDLQTKLWVDYGTDAPTVVSQSNDVITGKQSLNNHVFFVFTDPYYTAPPASIINTITLSAVDNALTMVIDITNVESGWTATLYNQTTFETISISESFISDTRIYADLDNGTWIYTATASDGIETVSNTAVIDYTPPVVVEPVERLTGTAGNWYNSLDYLYFGTTSVRYLYSLVYKETSNKYDSYNRFDVEYDPSDGKFYDVGSLDPAKWGYDNTGTNLLNFPTAANMKTLYWYNGTTLMFQFENPYYVQPYTYKITALEYPIYTTIYEIDAIDASGDVVAFDSSKLSTSRITANTSPISVLNDGKYINATDVDPERYGWAFDQSGDDTTTPFVLLALELSAPIHSIVVRAWVESEYPSSISIKLNDVEKLFTMSKVLFEGEAATYTYVIGEDAEYIYEFTIEALTASTTQQIQEIDLYDANNVIITYSDADVIVNDSPLMYNPRSNFNNDNLLDYVEWAKSGLSVGVPLFTIKTTEPVSRIRIFYRDSDKWHPISIKQNGITLATTPNVGRFEPTKTMILGSDPLAAIVENITMDAGTHWGDLGRSYYYQNTLNSKYVYSWSAGGGSSSYDIQYDYTAKVWEDKGADHPYTITQTGAFVKMTSDGYDGTNGTKVLASFTDPYYPVQRITGAGGTYNSAYDYYYFGTGTTSNRYLYGLVAKGATDRAGLDDYDVEYDYTTQRFHDVGSGTPTRWSSDDTNMGLSQYPTDANMKTHYWYMAVLDFQFENPYYIEPAGFRYLAFYGEPGGNAPTFHELELTLGTPLNGSSEIKYGVNSDGITFYESKAWSYDGGILNDYSTIMNGIKGFGNDPNNLQYTNVANINAVFWYMDLGAGVAADVNGGTYWTYTAAGYAFALGKLYGTNTDPATFADASLIANYEFVCDLTKQISA